MIGHERVRGSLSSKTFGSHSGLALSRIGTYTYFKWALLDDAKPADSIPG